MELVEKMFHVKQLQILGSFRWVRPLPFGEGVGGGAGRGARVRDPDLPRRRRKLLGRDYCRRRRMTRTLISAGETPLIRLA